MPETASDTVGNHIVFYTKGLELKENPDGDFVEGYITTGDLDLGNDIVTEHCMKSIARQLKERNIKLDLEHESIGLGLKNFDMEAAKTIIPLGKAVDNIQDMVGVKARFVLNKDYKRLDMDGKVTRSYDEVKRGVKNGFLDGFSIAYIPTDVKPATVDGKNIRLLNDVHLLNVGLTGNPMNPAAQIVKTSIKSVDKEAKSMTDSKDVTSAPEPTVKVGNEDIMKFIEVKSQEQAKTITELKSRIEQVEQVKETLAGLVKEFKELNEKLNKAQEKGFGPSKESKSAPLDNLEGRKLGPLDAIY